MKDHPPDEDLERYAMNRLEEPRLEPFEEHLLVCPECQDRLKETDRYVRAMRSAAGDLRRTKRSSPARMMMRSRWWGLAAAAAVGVLLTVAVLSLRPGPVATVLLQTSRGAVANTAPSGAALDLVVDLTELPHLAHYRVEVVDSIGREVWNSTASPVGGRLTLHPGRRLGQGVFYVRVYGDDAELLREYSLKIPS